MLSPTETGSKKHIIAERFYEQGFSENLCKLLISDYNDFQVLSLYSDLSNKLLAFKLIQQNSETQDPWLETAFLKTIRIDFNTSFDSIPAQFAVNADADNASAIAMLPESKLGYLHYTKGLFAYNASQSPQNKMYLFKEDDALNIILFKDKKCVFANTFEVKNETEMLYFLLNALEISDIQQNAVHIYLDYYLARKSEIQDFLKLYFSNIQNMKPDFGDPDSEIPFLSELLFVNHMCSVCV